jgi:protein-S-isoprenylcysteine O-methyltransferase Ste14
MGSRSGIWVLLPVVALVGVFLLLLSSLQSNTAFSDAWFPSGLASLAFKAVFCAWIVSEIVNNIWSRMNSKATSKDRGSYWVVMGAIWSAVVVILVSRSFGVGAFGGTLQYAGLVLVAAGIALREWAIWVLERHFTVQVRIREKARLVTEGPYSSIRHPSYTGGILILIGISLAVGSWLGLLYVLTVCLAAYWYRMQVEEKALQEAFGKEYEHYKKRTWKLVPGVW